MNRWRIASAIPVIAVLMLTGCSPTGSLEATVTSAGVDPEQAGYFRATGEVSGISEDGGTCVFTFWAKTGVATRLTGTGRVDGDHTSCGPVEQPLGFMVGVNYEAELKYVSRTGNTVVSESVPFTLPRPTAESQ